MQLNVFLFCAVTTCFSPCHALLQAQCTKGCAALCTEAVCKALWTAVHFNKQQTLSHPLPKHNSTRRGFKNMFNDGSFYWNMRCPFKLVLPIFLIYKKKPNKQLLVTTTSSLKTLLNKVQAIAQNKTHGPDNPSHKDCSSRNSSNKRKKKTLMKKHSVPPCRDYATCSALEGAVMNKMFKCISN